MVHSVEGGSVGVAVKPRPGLPTFISSARDAPVCVCGGGGGGGGCCVFVVT